MASHRKLKVLLNRSSELIIAQIPVSKQWLVIMIAQKYGL